MKNPSKFNTSGHDGSSRLAILSFLAKFLGGELLNPLPLGNQTLSWVWCFFFNPKDPLTYVLRIRDFPYIPILGIGYQSYSRGQDS